ncbi:MAG: tyrosine-type recombinase/integrase [Gallionellaceae bacterium]
MDREQAGVRVSSPQSIEIDFYYLGQRCREIIKILPTKANLQFAKNKRAAILHEIGIGTFNYAAHFPDSRRAATLGKVSNKTVSQALDEFLLTSRRTCEASTLRDYQSAIEYHLKPAFGDFLLRKITATQIKVWMGGLTITPKRINNVLIPLRSVLRDAFHDGVIERDISARIRNLSHRIEEPNPFTPSEIKSILEHADDQTRNLFQFAFWTGMRTSELIALEWGDVDFQRGLVRVSRASVRKIVKVTKTLSGEREVKLLEQALLALNAQKPFTFLANQRIFHNPKTNNPWETDGQIRKTAWTPLLKAANVPYRNPYQTRHTYASMMLSAGENPMWVAHQMGHKDWGMIRKRYGRWIPDVDPVAGSKATLYWSLHGQ